MKRGKGVPLYVTAAFAWFGYHCGAGFSSGKQVWLYAAQYGMIGFVAPVIIWLACTLFIFITAEYARLVKAKNYKDLSPMICENPKVNKFIVVLWDILIFMSALNGCSSCTAGFGSLLENLFHLPYYPSCILFVLLMIGILCFGKTVLERIGKMGTPLIIIFLSICLVAVFSNWDNLTKVLTGVKDNSPVKEITMFGLCKRAMEYAVIQSSFFQACSVLAGRFKKRSDTIKFAVLGCFINIFAMTLAVLAIMAYYPECGTNTMPLFYIVSSFTNIGGTLLMVAYNIVLVLAYVTTSGALAAGAQARYVGVLNKKIKNETVCRAIVVFVLMLGALIISKLGLEGVIEVMNKINSVTRFPCLYLPVLIFGTYAVIKKEKEEAKNKQLCTTNLE